jgi:hypothetical protein
MDGARARAIDGVTTTLRRRNARTATEDQKGGKPSSLAAAKRRQGNVLRLKRIDGMGMGQDPPTKSVPRQHKSVPRPHKINLFAARK